VFYRAIDFFVQINNLIRKIYNLFNRIFLKISKSCIIYLRQKIIIKIIKFKDVRIHIYTFIIFFLKERKQRLTTIFRILELVFFFVLRIDPYLEIMIDAFFSCNFSLQFVCHLFII